MSSEKESEVKLAEDSALYNVENQDGLKQQKRLIIKNVLIIGFSWILLFTAFQSISSLQSSLNPDGGLGTYSLSTIYVTLIVGSLFLPSTMIQKLGIKKTLFFSQLAYILYIGANIYPRYFTLIPTAIILGCKFIFNKIPNILIISKLIFIIGFKLELRHFGQLNALF